MARAQSLRLVSLTLALAGGAVGGVVGPGGCVLVEECIVVVANGEDWCVTMRGALMWPVGEPELAIPVLDDQKPPVACECVNLAEDEIMWTQAPQQQFEELAAEIEQDVRERCDSIVPIGWDHNCFDLGPEGPQIDPPYPGGTGECIGACFYTKPKCGDEPDPYECEEQYGVGETGAMDDVGGETGLEVGPVIEGELQWTR